MAVIEMEQINLCRQNSVSSTIFKSFGQMRIKEELFDITLACASSVNSNDTVFIKAHKVILAASSLVFKELIMNLGEMMNGIIYLSGIEEVHIKSILDFVYSGQVNVERNKLERFLQVAKELKIVGLASTESEAHVNQQESSQDRKVKKLDKSNYKVFQEILGPICTEVFGSTVSVGDGHFVHYSGKSVTLGFLMQKF